MSVAFVRVHVNLPIPLYGTLFFVIISSAMRYVRYACVMPTRARLQVHVDFKEVATHVQRRPRFHPRACRPALISPICFMLVVSIAFHVAMRHYQLA